MQHQLQVHCRKSPFPWLIMARLGSMSSSPRLRASSSRPSSENVLVSIGSVLFSKDSVSAGVASCSFTGAGFPLSAGESKYPNVFYIYCSTSWNISPLLHIWEFYVLWFLVEFIDKTSRCIALVNYHLGFHIDIGHKWHHNLKISRKSKRLPARKPETPSVASKLF